MQDKIYLIEFSNMDFKIYWNKSTLFSYGQYLNHPNRGLAFIITPKVIFHPGKTILTGTENRPTFHAS